MQLVEQATGQLLLARLSVANRFVSRAIGLLGRAALDPHEGLLFLRCRSLHTWFMRFTLDVVFLDDGWQVVEVHEAIAPFQMVVCGHKGRVHALETAQGFIARTGLRAGTRVRTDGDP